MPFGGPLQRFVNLVNAGVTALAGAPVVGRFVERYITTISYVGRKSGRTFSLPIGYRRTGDDITIGVSMPDQKSWWRNFLGAGAPMTIALDGTERTGHAVATRDDRGRVTVALHLDAQ
nr:nitroreductase family deazaflavin-dependent oxidoreductase [Mycolicibacterium komossense]